MKVNITIRVGAYIIRQNRQGLYELLLFQHPDCPEAPLQIPGGGVDPEESLETALHREILEESGLSHLPLLRKLGVAEICWREPRKLISYRHCFLLEAPQDTPNTWNHFVSGDGIDAGMCFSYFWHRPSLDFRLFYDLGCFLSPEHIPELYCGSFIAS